MKEYGRNDSIFSASSVGVECSRIRAWHSLNEVTVYPTSGIELRRNLENKSTGNTSYHKLDNQQKKTFLWHKRRIGKTKLLIQDLCRQVAPVPVIVTANEWFQYHTSQAWLKRSWWFYPVKGIKRRRSCLPLSSARQDVPTLEGFSKRNTPTFPAHSIQMPRGVFAPFEPR